MFVFEVTAPRVLRTVLQFVVTAPRVLRNMFVFEVTAPRGLRTALQFGVKAPRVLRNMFSSQGFKNSIAIWSDSSQGFKEQSQDIISTAGHNR